MRTDNFHPPTVDDFAGIPNAVGAWPVALVALIVGVLIAVAWLRSRRNGAL